MTFKVKHFSRCWFSLQAVKLKGSPAIHQPKVNHQSEPLLFVRYALHSTLFQAHAKFK